MISTWIGVGRRPLWYTCVTGRQKGPDYLEILKKLKNDIRQNFLNATTESEKRLWDPKYLYIQQDGATSHTTRENMEFLADWVGAHKIISNKSEKLIWSPMSPDLNPLDYFVWNQLKAFVGRKNPKVKEDILRAVDEFFESMPQAHIDDCILGKIDRQGVRTGGFVSRLNTVFALNGDSVQKVKKSTRHQLPDISPQYLEENRYFDEHFDRYIPDIAEDSDEQEGEFGNYEDFFPEY